MLARFNHTPLPMTLRTPPVYADVLAAAERLRDRAHRTPVLRCRSLDALAGCELFFKCEQLQRVGAFKFRGATNRMLCLSEEERARGVVTHSSGNHGQAVALAARELGVAATVVMPSNAPAPKRAAVAGYGATVVLCEPTLAGREAATARVIDEHGATLIHPFDDPLVIAGQGTAALELLEQVDDLDAVVAPVGGGGLAAGTTLVCGSSPGRPRPLFAEPAGADDAARGLARGQRVLPAEHTPRTIADGLLTTLGELTFSVLSHHEVEVATVADDRILHALELAWTRAKLLIEPSAATPLAALLDRRFAGLEGRRVGVILSGGNLDLAPLLDSLSARASELAG